MRGTCVVLFWRIDATLRYSKEAVAAVALFRDLLRRFPVEVARVGIFRDNAGICNQSALDQQRDS